MQQKLGSALSLLEGKVSLTNGKSIQGSFWLDLRKKTFQILFTENMGS